jgi:poly(A) polymerase
VIVGDHPYEVATFRRDLDYQDGRRPSKIAYATAEEDAQRRDFTINGMFYDPLQEKVLDFVDGEKDLKRKLIRAIGNPHERIKEDRLRMIRAIRLACRFRFAIDPPTGAAIRAHAGELRPAVAIERIVQELEKGKGFLPEMLVELHHYGLLGSVFPRLGDLSAAELERRVMPVRRFPAETPLIGCLLTLFPAMPVNLQLALCEELKLSNQDKVFVSLFHRAQVLLTAEMDDWSWAHFYAAPRSEVALAVAAGYGEDPHRILSGRAEHRRLLERAVARIAEGSPVVTSAHLAQVGIAPGKEMGRLLAAAERIAVNERLEEPEQVLQRLREEGLL